MVFSLKLVMVATSAIGHSISIEEKPFRYRMSYDKFFILFAKVRQKLFLKNCLCNGLTVIEEYELNLTT